MNENARKWVAALRSGEFTQARGVLRDEDQDSYCCLGVACELFRRDTGRGCWVCDEFEVSERDSNTSVLPRAVQDWLGLSTQISLFNYEGEQDQLSARNDRGDTFEQIAALIESEPEGLFVEGGER